MKSPAENRVLSNGCLPGHLLCANPAVILDAQYEDFDQQAERLVGFDQTYLQLTPGPFRGRFVSCFLGPGLSLHLEQSTQALEQSIACARDAYAVSVAVSDGVPFRLNGVDFGPDGVMIASPGAALHLRSPPNGAILAIVIERGEMERAAGPTSIVSEWFSAMHGGVRLLRAPQLSRRIREDAVQALQAVHFRGEDSVEPWSIGRDLLTGLVSKLSLELVGRTEFQNRPVPPSFDRFVALRTVIHEKWDDIRSMDDLLAASGVGGRRVVETSFSDQVEIGPLTYHRVLRLHLARKALRDSRQFGTSIGDIAARHEFWNWSQFSTQYQALFGERPSETRLKAGYGARSHR